MKMLSGKKEFGDEGYKKGSTESIRLIQIRAFGENPLEQEMMTPMQHLKTARQQ